MTNPLASQQPAPIPEDLEQFYKGDQYAVAEWSETREMWVLYDVPITLDGLIERIARLEDAILWADGQRDDFRERGPKEGAYWWRKELMVRAALGTPGSTNDGS
jgi:hypothetical protein